MPGRGCAGDAMVGRLARSIARAARDLGAKPYEANTMNGRALLPGLIWLAVLLACIVLLFYALNLNRHADYYRGVWDTCLYGSDNDLRLCAHFLKSAYRNQWYDISRGQDQFDLVWPVQVEERPEVTQ